MKNYFEYFPIGRTRDAWGVQCTGIGCGRILPGQSYPPRVPSHPPDHDFTWQRGRILQDLQLIFISGGAGFLEYKKEELHRIQPNTVFLVLPGIWHRYRPDTASGWTEHWIELNGNIPNKVLQQNTMQVRHPFFFMAGTPEISELFLKCHRLADTRPWAFEQQIGMIGLEILLLTLRSTIPKNIPKKEPAAEFEVIKLQQKLLDSLDEPLKLNNLLRNSDLSPVHFRRLFKKRTGLSPKQYLLQIRLRRTMDFLCQTNMSLADIAERLGYDTPYHLSRDFKNRIGVAPTFWRRTQWKKSK